MKIVWADLPMAVSIRVNTIIEELFDFKVDSPVYS